MSGTNTSFNSLFSIPMIIWSNAKQETMIVCVRFFPPPLFQCIWICWIGRRAACTFLSWILAGSLFIRASFIFIKTAYVDLFSGIFMVYQIYACSKYKKSDDRKLLTYINRRIVDGVDVKRVKELTIC